MGPEEEVLIRKAIARSSEQMGIRFEETARMMGMTPEELPEPELHVLAVFDESLHGTRSCCECLRIYSIAVCYAHRKEELEDCLKTDPDLVLVVEDTTRLRPYGSLIQRVRERGYEGPIVYYTWPGIAQLGWYWGADCVVCRDWESAPMAKLIKDVIASYRVGRLRRTRLARRQRLFISHASEDHAFVERLARGLMARGYFVWYDEWQLRVGDSIIRKIEEGLDESAGLIVVLSPASVRSKWVREELNAILQQQIDVSQVLILPVLYRHCELPPFLRDKLYADFTGEFDRAIETLVKRLPNNMRAGT